MTDHKTIDDVLRKSIFWEDPDAMLVIGTTEDGNFYGDKYWKMDFRDRAKTFLELLYQITPKCDCDEYEEK